MQFEMTNGEMLLTLVRFLIAMAVIYGIVACCQMILKIIINGTGKGIGMILQTKLGMAALAGGAIYVIVLALKGWVI